MKVIYWKIDRLGAVKGSWSLILSDDNYSMLNIPDTHRVEGYLNLFSTEYVCKRQKKGIYELKKYIYS